MGDFVTMNLKVNEYTSRVLGVVKETYGLKDKAQALDKFADLYGEYYVDREIKDELIQELDKIYKEHIKKHGFRTRTTNDLRKALEGK